MTSKSPIRAIDAAAMNEAAKLIRDGALVAFPTETVYGLGGDATNADAVARIFAAKGRPSFNPLISHVPDIRTAHDIAVFDDRAVDLANSYWPGPLTMVLPINPKRSVAELTTAGLDSIAVRIPGSASARKFLNICGVPVAAPSANRSGGVSPTRAEHVQMSLPGPDEGGPAMILDGGACDVGLESTVIDLTTEIPTLLRPGGLSIDDMETILGEIEIAGDDNTAPKSPGMMSRHYAPNAALRMNVKKPEKGEAFIGFGFVSVFGQPNLSPDGDLLEAAVNLFKILHALDASGTKRIAVAPIPDEDIGMAINDRLRRAVHT